MDPTLLLWALAAILVVVGILGTVLPILPGAVLVFLGLLVGAWADGFNRVGWPSLTLIGGLAVLSYAIDLAAGSLGARKLGASPRAAWGALAGGIVGLFFGLPGLLIGPFAGAFLGEWTVRREVRQAGRIGLGAWVGMVVGAAAKVALVFAMLGVFVLAIFF
ncbi:MAG: DUF456 domain-containing protein [Thermoanaerobaculia bacterium]|nr:DUF456 domain-containing protein [Thermoanaerobaculia bacterium]